MAATKLQKLQYQVDYYKYFYDTAPIGFYRTTLKDGYFLQANPFLIKMFGYNSLEELQDGLKASDIYPPGRRQDLLDALKEGEVNDFEIEATLPNGQTKSLLITARICPDDDCIEGSIMDITERKMELKSLRDAQGLIQKLKSLQDITHEVRSRILAYA